MKKLILFLICAAIAGFLTGCNATTETASQRQPDNPRPAEENSGEPEKAIVPADEWLSYYEEESNKALKARFDKAKAIVDEKANTRSLTLSQWSTHFNDWYLIELQPPPVPNDMIPLDAPTPGNIPYLVNLKTGDVIPEGHWNEARPIFDELLAAIQKAEKPGNIKSLTESMAKISSVVGLGTTDYVSDRNAPPPVENPKLTISPDETKLVYYISSKGMALFYTRCTLILHQSEITFESEIIRLDETETDEIK